MHPTLERLRGTVGVWSHAHESLAPTRIPEVAGAVEGAGYSAIWVPEAWGREALTGAQLLLGASSSLVVGTGIASIYARDAMAAAAGSKTLAEASSGRFVLGLGVSHRPLVERGRKGTYGPPIPAMRAYLDELAGAANISAERDVVVPTVLAALGPRMLGLARDSAGGALSYLVTPEHTASARASLGPQSFLAVELGAVRGEGRDEFLRRAHDYLNVYTGLENYRSSWRRLGFDDGDFVRGGSDRLCDAMVAHGDEAAILRRAEEHFDAGADHVCLQLLGATLDEVPFSQWVAVGAALGTRRAR